MEVKRWQIWVTKANRFLGTPLGMLIGFGVLLIIMVLFFVIRGASTQQKALDIARDSKKAAESSQRAVDDLKRVLCEDKVPEEECVLVQLAKDLKADSAYNRRIIACLLEVHGENDIISDDDRQFCDQAASQGFTESSPPIESVPQVEPESFLDEGAGRQETPPVTVRPEPETPEPPLPPQSGILESIGGFVNRNIINPILNILGIGGR